MCVYACINFFSLDTAVKRTWLNLLHSLDLFPRVSAVSFCHIHLHCKEHIFWKSYLCSKPLGFLLVNNLMVYTLSENPEKNTVLLHSGFAHSYCALLSSVSCRGRHSARTASGFQVHEDKICMILLRRCSCLFLGSSVSVTTCKVEQKSLRSRMVMPQFELFASDCLSPLRVLFGVFLTPTILRVLLDSLLLMWQPRCHRTIAPRWKLQRCWC